MTRPPMARWGIGDWRNGSIDWSRVTTIAAAPTSDPTLVCAAHERGVRLVMTQPWAAESSNADLPRHVLKDIYGHLAVMEQCAELPMEVGA